MRFAFRLCLQLGIDDPVAWFNAVPSQLVNMWMAYYSLEPWEHGVTDTPDKRQTPRQAFAKLEQQVTR